NNGERPVIDRNGLAYYARIRAVPAFPDAMAQHHDLIAARLLFFRKERAAKRGFYAEHLKEIGRCPHSPYLLRPFASGESVKPCSPRRDPFEYVVLVPPIDKV